MSVCSQNPEPVGATPVGRVPQPTREDGHPAPGSPQHPAYASRVKYSEYF